MQLSTVQRNTVQYSKKVRAAGEEFLCDEGLAEFKAWNSKVLRGECQPRAGVPNLKRGTARCDSRWIEAQKNCHRSSLGGFPERRPSVREGRTLANWRGFVLWLVRHRKSGHEIQVQNSKKSSGKKIDQAY